MASALPKMLTPHEVAEILGVSYETALVFIKYSGIDYLRIGRQYRVSEVKLASFINRKGAVTVETDDY